MFRLAEVKATKGSKETLIIIHNKVYNVSKFLEEVSWTWHLSVLFGTVLLLLDLGICH